MLRTSQQRVKKSKLPKCWSKLIYRENLSSVVSVCTNNISSMYVCCILTVDTSHSTSHNTFGMILPPTCLWRIEHNFPVCPAFYLGSAGIPTPTPRIRVKVTPARTHYNALSAGLRSKGGDTGVRGRYISRVVIKSKSAAFSALTLRAQQPLESLYANQKFVNKIAAHGSQLGLSRELKSDGCDFK